MLAEFHFLRPWWLLALLPWLLLLWQLRSRVASSAWQQVVDKPLLAWLSGHNDQHNKRSIKLLVLMAIAGLLAMLALAGPVWERQPQPVLRATQAQVIVLDLSRSMLANDQKPNRLEQARFKLADILNRSREGQTGLVAYAGEAFVISPLTDDSRTILALLPALAPDIMPVQGGRADLALQQAADLLHQAGENRGDILLIADAVNAQRTIPVVEQLVQSGIQVSVLAVGTEQGAPIPSSAGGFVQDSQGNIVIPRMDPQALRSVAVAGGGRYSRLSVDTSDLDYLFPEQAPEDVEQATRESDIDDQLNHELWREQGPWLVLLLLPFAALAFRRGWLFCCCLLPSLLFQTGTAEAAWEDWWKNPAQQTRQALDQGQHEQAAALSEGLSNQPLLSGEVHYRNGDFEAAADAYSKAFSNTDSAEGAYNLGNALAQLGSIGEAIEAYENALQRDPGMQDAKDNLEIMKQLQQQQEQQQEGESQDQQDGEQQDGEQQDGQQQEGEQDGQQNEQQDGEQQEGEQNQDGQQQQSEDQQSGEQQQDQQTESEQASDEQQDAEEPESSDEQSEQQTEQQTAEQQTGELTEQEAEQQRAIEQWLRRIPDDPGGLLRNKFRYQYQQRQRPNDSDEDDW